MRKYKKVINSGRKPSEWYKGVWLGQIREGCSEEVTFKQNLNDWLEISWEDLGEEASRERQQFLQNSYHDIHPSLFMD